MASFPSLKKDFMAPSIFSLSVDPSDPVMLDKILSVTPTSSFLPSSKKDVAAGSGSAAQVPLVPVHDDLGFDQPIDVRHYPSVPAARLSSRKLTPSLISGGGTKSGYGKKKISAVWDSMEDEEAVHFKIKMPGVGKENVNVSVEENSINIKGEGEKDENDSDETVKSYILNFEITPNLFKFDQVKAVMNNGVLKVSVPKLKKEERKDIFQVVVV